MRTRQDMDRQCGAWPPASNYSAGTLVHQKLEPGFCTSFAVRRWELFDAGRGRPLRSAHLLGATRPQSSSPARSFRHARSCRQLTDDAALYFVCTSGDMQAAQYIQLGEIQASAQRSRLARMLQQTNTHLTLQEVAHRLVSKTAHYGVYPWLHTIQAAKTSASHGQPPYVLSSL